MRKAGASAVTDAKKAVLPLPSFIGPLSLVPPVLSGSHMAAVIIHG